MSRVTLFLFSFISFSVLPDSIGMVQSLSEMFNWLLSLVFSSSRHRRPFAITSGFVSLLSM